ncbi:PR-1-like protein [Amniculicola lignicola CBS 123094]|uniref:PR-1-like protein n=1 Tax=Amniculicola lignicola CBS 123094 TaxID=1392246 RepID=A0A6A5WVF7_9PLEO|nr:PR-1-like protein [Amniculicola lignicola CBS 123094]
MRSAILVASALALGAIAKPVQKLEARYYVTKVDLEIKTVTVYVTPGAPAPTLESEGYGHGHHHKSSKKPSATPIPAPEYTPAPVPSSVDTPAPEPSSEAPAYTPVPSSAAPVPSPVVSSGSHKSGAIQATFSSGPDYEASVIYHHNAARANHGAAPLEWSEECVKGAQITAATCNFAHSGIPEGQGQNIFANSGDSFNISAAITESWYNGEFDAMAPFYGLPRVPENDFHAVGHLTAMLWKKTTKVGCVSVYCKDMTMPNGDNPPILTPTSMNKFTVCNYADSAPNMVGEFGENVGAPIANYKKLSWLD